jgi:hypothetical protein
MVGIRDGITLNTLYPSGERCIRLKVSENGNPIGWAVVLDTPLVGHKYFGNLRLGSIVDGLASPPNASKVIGLATSYLEQRGVELIVSNQMHCDWCYALRGAGFLRGPSNFLFTASKELTKLLKPIEKHKGGIHLNRGDGDGPIHL